MKYTLPEIYERIVAIAQGGYFTTDVLNNKELMYSLIHSARQQTIQERFQKWGTIPQVYYQPWTPRYDALSQVAGTNYTLFTGFPTAIALDGRSSGMGYIGTVIVDNCPVMFREVRTRSEFAAMQEDVIMRAGRKAYVLVDGTNVQVFYKNKIKELSIEAVFSVPTDVNSYNVDLDPYPMDLGDFARLEQILLQTDIGAIQRTPTDRVVNARADAVQPLIRT